MKQNTLIGAAVVVVAVGLILVVSSKKSDDTKPTPTASVSVSTSPKASSTASPAVSPTRTPVKTPTPTAMPTLTPTAMPTATPTPTSSVVGFQSAAYSVDEDEGPAVLTVTRTGNLAGEVSVSYDSAPGSAGSDDYTASRGTLTFASGVATRTISVNITNDDMLESAETFTFTLSGVSGNAHMGTAAATVTIVDDETNQ